MSAVYDQSGSGPSTQFCGRRLYTCEPSGKFLGMFSLHHAWLDCLGCGTTTGCFEHHTAPSTLPSLTTVTIHNSLPDQNVCSYFSMSKRNTQYTKRITQLSVQVNQFMTKLKKGEWVHSMYLIWTCTANHCHFNNAVHFQHFKGL